MLRNVCAGAVMAWSGGLTSIRLPFDAVEGGGKNYIDIGEEIPAEISANFQAGLVFRNGLPPAFPYGFSWWTIGISSAGSLEIVSYYYFFASPTADPTFYRETVLSLAPPSGVDRPPVLQLGHGAYGTYNEGPNTRVVAPGYSLPVEVGSIAERNTYDSIKYPGFRVIRTDMGGTEQRWDGTAWRYSTYGFSSGTTNVNGIMLIAHGGDGTSAPSAVTLTPSFQATDAIAQVFKPIVWSVDTTIIQLRAVRTDNSTYFGGQPINCYWRADW